MSINAVTSSSCCCGEASCGAQSCGGPCLEVTSSITSTLSYEESCEHSGGYCDEFENQINRSSSESFDFSGLIKGDLTYILSVNSPLGTHTYLPPSGNIYSESRFFGGVSVQGSGTYSYSETFFPRDIIYPDGSTEYDGTIDYTVSWEALDSNTSSNYYASGLLKHVKEETTDCDGDTVCSTTFDQPIKVLVKQTTSGTVTVNEYVYDQDAEEFNVTVHTCPWTEEVVRTVNLSLSFVYEETVGDCEDTITASPRVTSFFPSGISDPASLMSQVAATASRPGYQNAFCFGGPQGICCALLGSQNLASSSIETEDRCSNPFSQGSDQNIAIGRARILSVSSNTGTCSDSQYLENISSKNGLVTIAHTPQFPMTPVPCP
jgi:hypothetical protein